MKADIQSLGTFNRLAHERTEQATQLICQMTGLDAKVDVTKITFVDRSDVGEQLGNEEYVGGEHGRSLRLRTDSGDLVVKSADRDARTL